MEKITKEQLDTIAEMNSYGVACNLAEKINEIIEFLNFPLYSVTNGKIYNTKTGEEIK